MKKQIVKMMIGKLNTLKPQNLLTRIQRESSAETKRRLLVRRFDRVVPGS